MAAKADSAPTFGTPKKPGGFKTTQQDNVFTLSWDAVTEATSATALFFPAGVRYTVKCGSTTIADRTDKTTVTYTAEIPEEGQSAFSFSVTALLGNNQSEAYVSPTYLVGKPLEGEFRESFSNYSYDNSGWTVEGDTKNKWMPSAGNSYPAINPQDNDNGCLSFAHDAGKGTAEPDDEHEKDERGERRDAPCGGEQNAVWRRSHRPRPGRPWRRNGNSWTPSPWSAA